MFLTENCLELASFSGCLFSELGYLEHKFVVFLLKPLFVLFKMLLCGQALVGLLSSHVIKMLICHDLGFPNLIITMVPVLLGFLKDFLFLDTVIADKLCDLHLLLAFDDCYLVKV